MSARTGRWPDTGSRRTRRKISLFPVLLMLIPVAVTAMVTYRSTSVETALVERSLHHQAEMVARGLVASLNVGMMHSAWTPEILQDLLDANARESGAALIFLASPQGVVAASSGPLDLGSIPEELVSPAGSRTIPQDGLFLEEPDLYVYRRTLGGSRPASERSPFGMGEMMGMHNAMTILPDDLSITVVLDAAGTSTLKKHHLRMNLVTALFLAISIAGIAGWAFYSQKARETADALARTESYAREIVTRMPAGLLLCNDEGNIVLSNPGAAQILGMTEERLRGQPARDIFPEQILPCDSLRRGKDHPVTEGTMTVEGRRVTVNLSATPIPGEGEEPGGFLILFQDINEIENLRGRLARSERLAEIGELSSTVAHEIRNPLSSIRGLAQLLAGKVPGDQGAMMKTIVQEVDRLNRVVSSLLSYARQENLRPQNWEVRDILEHVRILAEGDARLKQVVLSIGDAPADLIWPLDRDMIIQALLNLLMNAIEVSSSGQAVELSAQVRDGNLIFQVRDEGPGVPEDSEKLFALFETTKEGGTGLGLPLVRKVAQLHGGGASIRRVGSGGSVALLWIPAREEEQSA